MTPVSRTHRRSIGTWTVSVGGRVLPLPAAVNQSVKQTVPNRAERRAAERGRST